MTPAETDEASSRPRIEGEREQEILQAALAVLCDVGYDRLTMDAVATRAKASKATLYRRWSSKSALVIDALIAEKEHPDIPDTGSLRDDLVQMNCGAGGLCDQKPVGILASVLTAIQRDPDFATEFRERFVGPKAAANRVVYDRARERGEIRDDLDIDLISHALPGIVLQRLFLLGDQPTEELITSVVDEIIIPVCRA